MKRIVRIRWNGVCKSYTVQFSDGSVQRGWNRNSRRYRAMQRLMKTWPETYRDEYFVTWTPPTGGAE